MVAHWAPVRVVRIKVASHVGNLESVTERFGNPQTSTRPSLSVGTVGDAYDNARAECVIGLFKTEIVNQTGPW